MPGPILVAVQWLKRVIDKILEISFREAAKRKKTLLGLYIIWKKDVEINLKVSKTAVFCSTAITQVQTYII